MILKPGDTVRYVGVGSWDINEPLVRGRTYTIDKVEVDGDFLDVYLTEDPNGSFDSHVFEVVHER